LKRFNFKILIEKIRFCKVKIKHFRDSKSWERRWMRGENKSLIVEREELWKRLGERSGGC